MTTSTRAVFVGVAVAASLVAPATARGDGIMLVSAGAFWMGRDDGPAEERPRHRVFVTDFWIERHKVTNAEDRKSTRLNSSHGYISYAVFCLKKKTQKISTLE